MRALPRLNPSLLRSPRRQRRAARPPFSTVDSGSGLEPVDIAETRITDEEVQALHQVISELSDYIRRTAPGPGPGPEAMTLLIKAEQIVGLTSR